MRIFQLAKELNVDSQEILDALEDMGVPAKSNLASLEDPLVEELRELFKPKPKASAASPSTREATVKKALEEREAREKAAREAARREDERKEAARRAALEKASARRAEQRKEREAERSAPAPQPLAAPPALPATGTTEPQPAAAEPTQTPEPQPQPEAPAAKSAPPPAAATPPAGAPRSTLGKAVIAPPPTSAKERAQLLGRRLGASSPSSRTQSPGRPSPPPRQQHDFRRPQYPGSGPAPGRGKRRAARKGKGRRGNDEAAAAKAAAEAAEALEAVGEVKISEGVTIKDVAERMNRKSKDVIKKLFLEKGIMATINHALDEATARWVVESFGGTPELVDVEDEAAAPEVEFAGADTSMEGGDDPRPPVVTMMGHVDHGKTSLLDAIRTTRVAEREAGGITQHIGAYKIEHEHEGKAKEIVFLDTPGHEAFTLMRARGASVTDIVVLVVAADDGVMPQTIEAINHAKAAEVPLIVAVNKVDKPDAKPERVSQQLVEHGVVVEQFGGDVVACPVSAKTQEGIDHLLEMILLLGDIGELKADAARPARGTVLEAKLDRSRGPVATVLVQNGTLRKGDVFVIGSTMGRVRALMDDHDRQQNEAGPATPIVVLGLEDVPSAGDTLQVFPDEQRARQLSMYRQQKVREEELARRTTAPTLEGLFEKIQQGQVNELPVVLKGDVAGSVETLEKSLTDLSTDEVRVQVIHSGTGAITETDILLAAASRAIVVGFNVRPERGVADIAAREGIDIRLHTVIYNVSDEIKKAMLATLSPVEKEVYLGRAQIREIFRVPKIGTVAGCMIVDGVVRRDASVRVLRDNVVFHEGKLASLRRFKDDAKEVRQGFECGMSLERFQDLKPGDEIEAFVIEYKKRESLESTTG